jgi:hypothetical protein
MAIEIIVKAQDLDAQCKNIEIEVFIYLIW